MPRPATSSPVASETQTGSAPASPPVRSRHVVLLGTVVLALLATGIGLFEGHVVYPSWRNLAGFDRFATYHSAFGQALLLWLPFPLLIVTALNVWLVARPPTVVSRRLPVAALACQLVIVGLTGALFIPIQQQLGTPGHTPAETLVLIDRLIQLTPLRDLPGIAAAACYIAMLHLQLRITHQAT